MGSVTARTLATRIRTRLLDTESVVWTDGELLEYLSEAQQTIPRYKPDAYVRNVARRLQAGTRQEIPDDGLRLVAIPRNMGSDGRTPGRAVLVADLQTINREDPDWHTRQAAPEVVEVYYDPSDPKRYYVSPPQPEADRGHVEMVYAAVPPEMTSLDNRIVIDDVYQASLVDYGCAKALEKLGRDGDGQRADFYFNRFTLGLQAQSSSETAAEPAPGERR